MERNNNQFAFESERRLVTGFSKRSIGRCSNDHINGHVDIPRSHDPAIGALDAHIDAVTPRWPLL